MNIVNPILAEAYEHDWYYPWTVPGEVASDDRYLKAVEEGWHEWIQSPLDWEAVKAGFVYDQSRDVEDNPAYWFNGAWQLHDGTRIEAEDEEDYIAHVGRGDHFMRFAEVFLTHTKAPLEGKPYRFLPWMRAICAPLFGWVATNKARYRRFQHLYVAIAKKNGKSALMSVISLYMLIADETPKAQVYSCACDRNQARIIYDESSHMVEGSPTLSEVINIVDSRARLAHPGSGSFYAVLSADAHRNDGIDSSCTLVDEIHRHPNRKLYSVMLRAGQARPEPLLGVITTYGPSLSDGSIWAEIHNEGKAQLEGQRPDSWRNMVFIASAEPIEVTTTATVLAGQTRIPVTRLIQPVDVSEIEFDVSQFAEGVEEETKIKVKIVEPAKRFQDYLVVEPLEEDLPKFSQATANQDWRSDHAICRANPSVGVVFEIDRLRERIAASRTPELEAETRQLNLNIVSGSGRKWLSAASWSACGQKQIQPKALIQRPCFGGLDLSFANDLLSFGLAFPKWELYSNFDEVPPKDRCVDLLTWAWVPESHLEDREDAEKFPYRHYAKQSYLFDGMGHIRICKGRVIDFAKVAEDIIEICRMFQVAGIAYDPNYGSFVIPILEADGLSCISHRQGAVAMSPPCKRFSQGVYEGWIAHGNNEVLTRAVEGAQLHPPDKAGNTYLSKGNSVTRIDPLVAQVMAVGFCCDPPEDIEGAYSGMWN